MGFSHIIFGLIVLVFGRKLFWLFVAIVGFLVGMEFAGAVLADRPQWMVLLVALSAGVFGALLAVLAERVAFALGGFYAGSYLAVIFAESLGADGNSMVWFAVGGLIGSVFAAVIMDWAIIVLSCLVGSGIIVQGLDLGQAIESLVFVALAVVGAFLQARLMTRSETARRLTRPSS